MRIYWHDGGHITKMAAMPIYGKNPSKIFLSVIGGLISKKLGRARKLYTSARIYEWKLGKGEWKFPIARPTGRVDFLGCS